MADPTEVLLQKQLIIATVAAPLIANLGVQKPADALNVLRAVGEALYGRPTAAEAQNQSRWQMDGDKIGNG